MNRRAEYLKDKINGLKINKNRRDTYKGNNGLKAGYRPRKNLLTDEKGYLLTDSQST